MSLVGNKIRRCGWVLDTPDQRDRLYAAPVVQLKKLPQKVDLRSQRPKVIYDRGRLGSCTGNAIACAIQFDRLKQKRKPDFIPSHLFIYYNERYMEGTVASDSSAQIRDGIKSVAKLGDCPETEWPYDISKFATKPSVSGRLRRQTAALHRAQFVGEKLGHTWLLHGAVCVFDRFGSGG